MTDRIADILDGLALFQDFSYPELKTISHFVTHVAHKQGAVLFEEGDPGDTMLILAEGKLSIFKGGEHGTQLLSHEGRGRMVGEMALLDNERRSATCVDDTDCEVLTLSLDGLTRMSHEAPLLAYKFMFSLAKILSRRLRKTSGLLVDFLN
jgi:CRP/FNR family cyclic AMP-dependent transcriptional regulator